LSLSGCFRCRQEVSILSPQRNCITKGERREANWGNSGQHQRQRQGNCCKGKKKGGKKVAHQAEDRGKAAAGAADFPGQDVDATSWQRVRK